MKRYLVFAHFDFCPAGGWMDFHGSFDSLETITLPRPTGFRTCHIVDTEIGDRQGIVIAFSETTENGEWSWADGLGQEMVDPRPPQLIEPPWLARRVSTKNGTTWEER